MNNLNSKNQDKKVEYENLQRAYRNIIRETPLIAAICFFDQIMHSKSKLYLCDTSKNKNCPD